MNPNDKREAIPIYTGKRKKKNLLRIIFGRTAFITLFLLLQIAFLFTAFKWLSSYLAYFMGASTVLSAVVLIHIISDEENSSIKLSWVVPLLLFPVFGTLFYLFIQLQPLSFLLKRRLRELEQKTEPYLKQDEETLKRYNSLSRSGGNLVCYMNRYGKFPVYENTAGTYFPSGEAYHEALLEQLRRAESYIFMEYFIVEPGMMWDSILEVLEKKAKEGVEVRFMYDGMGCLTLLPHNYPKQLEKRGIRCKVFSPIKPALSTYQNNRDHRKICVIDGKTAFTGGVNLADEYINQKKRFGHWKDSGIMIQGEAVSSFAMMFLHLWEIQEKELEDYSRFLVPKEKLVFPDPELGFVLPYADSPMDGENVGEQVYLDILGNARRYVHITTPYLILDDITLAALKYAAKRGVETMIIMPHIPDKLYAYLLARSYYEELLKAGVRIFEYTPGFIHAKSFVSDDEEAVVGTINLDYRSLYLHFECAVYVYRNPVVKEVEADFQETLKKCQEITLESCRSYPLPGRFAGRALRLFAPQM